MLLPGVHLRVPALVSSLFRHLHASISPRAQLTLQNFKFFNRKARQGFDFVRDASGKREVEGDGFGGTEPVQRGTEPVQRGAFAPFQARWYKGCTEVVQESCT